MDWGDVYRIGAWITGIIAFLASWIYAVLTFGLFIGVGLGWIPSLVIGFIAGLLWPLIALVLVGIVIVVIYAVNQ